MLFRSVAVTFFSVEKIELKPAENVPTQTLAVAQQHVDEAYTKARAELLDALAQREGQLSPKTKVALRDTMAVIDNALNELNVALADDPENPALLHMLVATRDKELNVLEQIVTGPEGL